MGLCGSAPKQPDYAAQTREGVFAQAEALPIQRAIDSAAQRGEKITIGGKTYDFTGLGDADYNAKYADQMAKAMLDLQKELGPQYIQQRLAELETADPAGMQARKKLFSSIVDQANKVGSNSADSEALYSSVLAELQKGGQLPDDYAKEISQGVKGQQVARGNFMGNAAATQEAGTLLTASDALRQSRQNAAMALLQSGATPEDIRYRENQQAIANLTSFANGTSPTAQFQGLQGAQQGAVPWQASRPGIGFQDDGSGAAGFGQSVWGQQMNDWSNQANPWLAGLSLGIQGYGAYSQFAPQSSGTKMAGNYGGGSAWG